MSALAGLAAGSTPVLAVSHAGVLRAVLCRLTGFPMDDLFRFRPGHLECTVLSMAHGRLGLVKTGASPKAISHFKAMGVPRP